MNDEGRLIGLVFGYITSFLWCLRWVPTLVVHIKKRQVMNINNSFIAIESLACLCGVVYGCLDGLTPIIITNGLGFLTTIIVVINNKCNAVVVVD